MRSSTKYKRIQELCKKKDLLGLKEMLDDQPHINLLYHKYKLIKNIFSSSDDILIEFFIDYYGDKKEIKYITDFLWYLMLSNNYKYVNQIINKFYNDLDYDDISYSLDSIFFVQDKELDERMLDLYFEKFDPFLEISIDTIESLASKELYQTLQYLFSKGLDISSITKRDGSVLSKDSMENILINCL